MFCGRLCSKEHYRLAASMRTQSKELGVSKSVVGALSEYRVVVDLLARGYEVYRAVHFHAPVDIIAAKPGGAYVRIEVKTAHTRGEKVYHPPAKDGRSDVVAAVTMDQIIYIPPLTEE